MNKKKERILKWPISIEAKIRYLLKEACEKELKPNKNRHKRGGGQRPLTAFMSGAYRKSESKILQVVNGSAEYSYKTLGASIVSICRRISERRSLTYIQHQLLLDYVSRFYRGDPSDNFQYFGTYNQMVRFKVHESNLLSFQCKIYEARKSLNTNFIPLRFIIDERLTNLILIDQFEKLSCVFCE